MLWTNYISKFLGQNSLWCASIDVESTWRAWLFS